MDRTVKNALRLAQKPLRPAPRRREEGGRLSDEDKEALSHKTSGPGVVEFAPVQIEEPLTGYTLPLGQLPKDTAAAVNPALEMTAQVVPYLNPYTAPVAAARDLAVAAREGSPTGAALAVAGIPGVPGKVLGAASKLARAARGPGGDIEGEVQFLEPKTPDSVTQPNDVSRETFLKKELEGSAPQYVPENDFAARGSQAVQAVDKAVGAVNDTLAGAAGVGEEFRHPEGRTTGEILAAPIPPDPNEVMKQGLEQWQAGDRWQAAQTMLGGLPQTGTVLEGAGRPRKGASAKTPEAASTLDQFLKQDFYHGSGDPNLQWRQRPTYFTPDEAAARTHADMDAGIDEGTPSIYRARLNVSNPAILSDIEMQDLHLNPERVQELQALGHDSAVKNGKWDEIVVFDPKHIQDYRSTSADAPALTKTQSQEAMRQAWEAGQGDPAFKNWNHQWNVQEGPKFRAAPVEAAPVAPVAVAPPEPYREGYTRLVNPAGFYSRAHEVAMNELPEGARPWHEMRALLTKEYPSGPRVNEQEMHWSGLHDDAFAPDQKVTREEIAALVDRNFPKVGVSVRGGPERKSLSKEMDKERVAARDAYNASVEAYDQALFDYHSQPDSNPGAPSSGTIMHELSNYPEKFDEFLETLPEEMRPAAANMRDRLSEFRDATNKFADAVGDTEYAEPTKHERYTVPGGQDYQERILTHEYNPVGHKEHPQVAAKYDPLLDEVDKASRVADKEYEAAKTRWTKEIYNPYVNQLRRDFYDRMVADGRKQGWEPTTPERLAAARVEYDSARNAAAEAQMALNEASDLYYKEQMTFEEKEKYRLRWRQLQEAASDAQSRYHVLEGDTPERLQEQFRSMGTGHIARQLGREKELAEIMKGTPEMQAAQDSIDRWAGKWNDLMRQKQEETAARQRAESPGYTQNRFVVPGHWDQLDNPIAHTRLKTRNFPEHGKVLHEDEAQSDWASQGREKGFHDIGERERLEAFLRDYSETRDAAEEALRAELEPKFGPDWGDTPEAVQAFKERVQPLMDARNEAERQLRQIQTERSIPSAPYVGKTEHWSDLAAKDVLAHALENDFDKIFITGPQEQAKRWSSQLRQAVDNVKWGSGEKPLSQDSLMDVRDQFSQALMDNRQYHMLDDREKKTIDDVIVAGNKATRDDIQRGEYEHLSDHLPESRNDISRTLFGLRYSEVAPEMRWRVDRQAIPLAKQKAMEEAAAAKGTKVVHATPKGGGNPHTFTVRPVTGENGKTQFKVVDSSLHAAKGELLSNVIGADLAKRVMAEESGDVAMNGYMMGSEGYRNLYEKARPESYRKLLKGLDPEGLKIEPGVMPGMVSGNRVKNIFDELIRTAGENEIPGFMQMEQEQQFAAIMELAKQKAAEEAAVAGTWVHLTPKARAEYMRLKQKYGAVFPAYKRGGTVKRPDRSKLRDYALDLSRKIAAN